MSELDLAAAHRHFAVHCFNACWQLIGLPDRTPEQEEEMLLRAMTSLWHWKQRADVTPTNLSIGCWQVARVYALLGRADDARRYGNLCLDAAQTEGVEIVFQAFAHEALARAEKVAGNADGLAFHRAEAERLTALVDEEEERKMVEADLATL